jgi:hypothetical protein
MPATGAVKMLSDIDNTDWVALYAGRICLDEVPRVRRIVRRDLVHLPHFMADIVKYRRMLVDIGRINGLPGIKEPLRINLFIEPHPASNKRKTHSGGKQVSNSTARLADRIRGNKFVQRTVRPLLANTACE